MTIISHLSSRPTFIYCTKNDLIFPMWSPGPFRCFASRMLTRPDTARCILLYLLQSWLEKWHNTQTVTCQQWQWQWQCKRRRKDSNFYFFFCNISETLWNPPAATAINAKKKKKQGKALKSSALIRYLTFFFFWLLLKDLRQKDGGRPTESINRNDSQGICFFQKRRKEETVIDVWWSRN